MNCETTPVAKLIACGAYFLKLSNIVEAALGPDGVAAGDGAGFVGVGFGAGLACVGPGFGAGFVAVGAGFVAGFAAAPPIGGLAAPPLTGFVDEIGLEELDGRALDNGGRALDAALLRDAAGATASKNVSSKSKNPISITGVRVKRTTCGRHYACEEHARLCVNVRSDTSDRAHARESFFVKRYVF